MTSSQTELEAALAAYRRGDFESALAQLVPLAKAGETDAQLHLARMYSEGEGVNVDRVQAYFWLELSCESAAAAEYMIALREQLAAEMSRPEMDAARRLLAEHYAAIAPQKVTPLCVEVTKSESDVESFFKILRGGEAFFVRVSGADFGDQEFYDGIADNDLCNTEEHGLNYGDPVCFALGEIIPPQYWSATGGWTFGMYRYTLGHLQSTDETKHGLHIRPAR